MNYYHPIHQDTNHNYKLTFKFFFCLKQINLFVYILTKRNFKKLNFSQKLKLTFTLQLLLTILSFSFSKKLYAQVNFTYWKNLIYFTFLNMHTKFTQIKHKSRNEKAPGSNAQDVTLQTLKKRFLTRENALDKAASFRRNLNEFPFI